VDDQHEKPTDEQAEEPTEGQPQEKANWREKLEGAKEWIGGLADGAKEKFANIDPHVIEMLRQAIATKTIGPVRKRVKAETVDIRKKMLWIFGAITVALLAAGFFAKMEVFYWSAYSFALSLVILLVVLSIVETRILRVVDNVHDRVVGAKPAEG